MASSLQEQIFTNQDIKLVEKNFEPNNFEFKPK